ncbi:hypothetical protein, partial [Deinococcus wulumuqiensis]|uniref:hypothetical protein n=1 Tax=Deinococcus wulumuqiensis TaxID=980427 RepID=UPI002431DB8F
SARIESETTRFNRNPYEVLDGSWKHPVTFALVWSVMGLGYGWTSLALDRPAAGSGRPETR